MNDSRYRQYCQMVKSSAPQVDKEWAAWDGTDADAARIVDLQCKRAESMRKKCGLGDDAVFRAAIQENNRGIQ